MKFIANPNKFIFLIGVCIVGFLFIFSYMILNQLLILIPLLILWILLSIFLIIRNYVEYIIQDEKIIIKSMKKNFEIKFDDIDYIILISCYENTLKEKKYVLKLKNQLIIPDRFLKIENKTFTKWIMKQNDRFKIKKIMHYE